MSECEFGVPIPGEVLPPEQWAQVVGGRVDFRGTPATADADRLIVLSPLMDGPPLTADPL